MGLINETNAEYYSGEKFFFAKLTNPFNTIPEWEQPIKQAYYKLDCSTFNTTMHDRGASNPASIENYYLEVDSSSSAAPFSFSTIDNETQVNGNIKLAAPNWLLQLSNEQVAEFGYNLMFRLTPTIQNMWPSFPTTPAPPLPTALSAIVDTQTSGSGTGAQVYINVATNGDYQVYLVNGGSGYEVGDTLTIQQDAVAPGVPNVDVNSVPLVAEELYSGRLFSVKNNTITFNTVYQPYSYSTLATSGSTIQIQLSNSAIAANYGGYSYVKLGDIINNFIVGYVGYEKTISRVNRTDVMFHARRGMQEFSYDLLKVVKSQELTIPPSLCVPIPQDYVNYVKVSWVDGNGGKHIIYPTRVTSNPTELPIQDANGIPEQDYLGENLQAAQSITDDRWANQKLTTDWQYEWNDITPYPGLLGERYGLQPEEAQVNGKFTINERLGKFCFTSDLVGKVIIFEYISDGLAYDEDMLIPKMAEEAIYMYIAHAVLSTRKNTPEYIINRYKREKVAAYRNAKIRLSNVKIEEIAQVMRNKSKWIKH